MQGDRSQILLNLKSIAGFGLFLHPFPRLLPLGCMGEHQMARRHPTAPLGVLMAVLRPDVVPALPGCPLHFFVLCFGRSCIVFFSSSVS